MRRLLLLLLLAPALAFGQYPSKPLKWIVPFPPGGPTDSFSRPVAAKLAALLGQPVVVENVAGAGASIGTDRLAKSPADGYTVALATTGSSPDIRQRLSAQAFELWTSSPEEFSRVIRADHEKWGRIVKASGARID